MNARKTIVILGGLIVAFIIGVVTFSLFKINQLEKEKNFNKTAPARKARADKREEPKGNDAESSEEFKQEELTLSANENS